MEEKSKKLIAKGILKRCDPPINPYIRENQLVFRTCPKPLLEKPSSNIVNHPSFNVDNFLFWYFFFKLFR